jgi:hypothetical protein
MDSVKFVDWLVVPLVGRSVCWLVVSYLGGVLTAQPTRAVTLQL